MEKIHEDKKAVERAATEATAEQNRAIALEKSKTTAAIRAMQESDSAMMEANRINAQLDPSVPLSSLVSNTAPYDGLEAIPGSLEMTPTPGHPDYPSA